MNQRTPVCDCGGGQDPAVYHDRPCPMWALMIAAPELLAALDETARLWHYNHAAQPGSPCYNLGFSQCEGLRCATNRAAIRKATGG